MNTGLDRMDKALQVARVASALLLVVVWLAIVIDFVWFRGGR